MKTFVIIFHQTPQTLTDADRQRLTEETIPWARQQNGAGHGLDPRILAPERALAGPETAAAAEAEASPITALLFLQAQDLSEAAQLAESHPALRYGFQVEVRGWSPPGAPAASSSTLR
jgi:hypothetical protein